MPVEICNCFLSFNIVFKQCYGVQLKSKFLGAWSCNTLFESHFLKMRQLMRQLMKMNKKRSHDWQLAWSMWVGIRCSWNSIWCSVIYICYSNCEGMSKLWLHSWGAGYRFTFFKHLCPLIDATFLNGSSTFSLTYPNL